MKFDREILEMIPCTGNVVAQFEQKNGEIEVVPVIAFARCITFFDWNEGDCDCSCEGCSCECDDAGSEELVIPMVVMNDDDYVSFADEHSNYIGMKRI